MTMFKRPDAAELVKTLRRVPLFNELSESELVSIATGVFVSRYKAEQVVFSEGEQGGDLLIVMEGTVRIVKLAANGRHQLLAIERKGASLGEVSVFDGGFTQPLRSRSNLLSL